MILSIFALGGIVTLTGCTSEADLLRQQGQPIAYVDGFDDGCHSGKKAGGSLFDQFRKDVRRFEGNHEYASGWSDGFRQCETQQESIKRQTRMNMQYQQYSEQRRHNQVMESEHFNDDLLNGIDTRGLENLK
ncbi:MAG: hypothetical protein KAI02_07305 [Gammaproteobacteria bacterium]|nr:hypothetical protein [Gammaproteobacteria bacterium]